MGNVWKSRDLDVNEAQRRLRAAAKPTAINFAKPPNDTVSNLANTQRARPTYMHDERPGNEPE